VAAQPSGKAATTYPSYLRTAQVADLLYVSPKTVSRWAKEGKLPFLKTLGGHRRFPEAEIRELAEELREEAITWAVQPSMKDSRPGSRSATPREALPDWEPDDQAGKQSNGAIYDDIDRRIQALLTGLVPASVWDNRATQIASAWLQGQKESVKRRPVLMPRLHEESMRADRVGLLGRFDVRCRHLNLH
jgi:excisionase family DNA binding protein